MAFDCQFQIFSLPNLTPIPHVVGSAPKGTRINQLMIIWNIWDYHSVKKSLWKIPYNFFVVVGVVVADWWTNGWMRHSTGNPPCHSVRSRVFEIAPNYHNGNQLIFVVLWPPVLHFGSFPFFSSYLLFILQFLILVLSLRPCSWIDWLFLIDWLIDLIDWL